MSVTEKKFKTHADALDFQLKIQQDGYKACLSGDTNDQGRRVYSVHYWRA